MATKNLEPLKEQIREIIKNDPSIRYEFLGWVTAEFVPKSDYSKILDEIKELRESSEKRWDENNKRWDENNKRWVESDKHFDAVHQEIKELREDSNRRFEEAAAERKQMREDSNKRFAASEQRFDKMQSSLDHINLTVGGFQNRAGKNLETTVASVLRFGLNNPDISPESLKLRQKIVDKEGLIGKPGKQYEYDLLPHNGEYFVIEIKSGGGVKREEIERLCDKAELVQHNLGLPAVKKVFITLGKTGELIHACEELDVMLIA